MLMKESSPGRVVIEIIAGLQHNGSDWPIYQRRFHFSRVSQQSAVTRVMFEEKYYRDALDFFEQ